MQQMVLWAEDRRNFSPQLFCGTCCVVNVEYNDARKKGHVSLVPVLAPSAHSLYGIGRHCIISCHDGMQLFLFVPEIQKNPRLADSEVNYHPTLQLVSTQCCVLAPFSSMFRCSGQLFCFGSLSLLLSTSLI